MPVWVPLTPAAIAAVVAVCIFVLTGRRERAKSKREAIAKFRAAFAEATTQIDNKDVHSIMRRAAVQHDVAIYEFRRVIEQKHLQHFDAAVEKFRRCRDELIPVSLAVWASLGSGEPIDNSDTLRLKVALNKLLAFADSA